jgi:hypothetical protein
MNLPGHHMAELTTYLKYNDRPDIPARTTCECGWKGLAVEHDSHVRTLLMERLRSRAVDSKVSTTAGWSARRIVA